MRTKFQAIAVAVCVLGMTGCANEMNEPDGQAGKQVVMTIQAASDGVGTRADYTEEGTKMNFSWRSGDAISAVVAGTDNANSQLTATADGKSASFTGMVTEWGSDTKPIYAFYPYATTPYTVTGGETPETATAVLTLPNPQAYTVGGAISNSFLVGTGTATVVGGAIEASASLKQVMSIVKLKITNAKARVATVMLRCGAAASFPTTATVTLSTGEITDLGDWVDRLLMTVTDDTDAPDKEISLAMFPMSLTNEMMQIEVTFTDGSSRTIEKNGKDFVRNMHSVVKFDATPGIEIGDFYMNDGTIVSKNASLTAEQKDNCIGVVLKCGRDNDGRWTDDCVYKQKNGGVMPTIRGYVLALHNAGDDYPSKWGPLGRKVDHPDMNRDSESGFYGYKNTNAIKEFATSQGMPLATSFPAIYSATTLFEEKYPSPENSSGWFVPSSGQCWYWLFNKETLLASIRKATEDPYAGWQSSYWSSSEFEFDPAGVVCYLKIGSDIVPAGGKNSSYNIQSVLTF